MDRGVLSYRAGCWSFMKKQKYFYIFSSVSVRSTVNCTHETVSNYNACSLKWVCTVCYYNKLSNILCLYFVQTKYTKFKCY